MYNFDEIIDRRHTNAMNTDGFRDYIFHADETMKFPYKDEEFIRMWVADMEFATPDVVIDGETGILVPEKDPEALARAFQKLEGDVSLERRLVESAARRIDKCFDWKKIAERQIAVYRSLLNKA